MRQDQGVSNDDGRIEPTKPGDHLRERAAKDRTAVPLKVWSVENNVSLANMDVREFVDAADAGGIFRGFAPVASTASDPTSSKRASLSKSGAPSLSAAQTIALHGDVEPAVHMLVQMLAAGHVSASAALAEIAGFQGRWREAIRHAEQALGAPDELWTHNVYEEMVRLLARAGREQKAWAEILRVAAAARARLSKGERDEARVRTIGALTAIARAKGKGELFPRESTEEAAQAAFGRAVEKLSVKKQRFKTADDRRDHFYSVACAYGAHASAVALYDEAHVLPRLMFDDVVFLASGLARRGRIKEAWEAVRSKLHLWWPVAESQIAPLDLLTDQPLAAVMTPERCAEILRTPRGPEAQSRL